MTAPETVPTEEARKKLGDLLNAAQFAGQHTAITRHGKVTGFLVPAEWHAAATDALAEVQALREQIARLQG